jgi:hypothetical protein
MVAGIFVFFEGLIKFEYKKTGRHTGLLIYKVGIEG